MRRRGTNTARAASVRVAAGLVAGVVVTGALGGCFGGPDEPSWTPTVWTPEETVEPTPTPTPVDPAAVAPERPAAMDEVSEAGAEAVARYFLELYPYVYATGDLTAWRELSHPECVFCASVISNVEEQVAAGNRSEGGGMTVDALSCVQVSNDFFTVTADVDQEPSAEYDADGVVVDTSTGDPAHVTIAVVPSDLGLIIREVQVDPLGQS
ncbi:MAG TPA: DUF6318 family protein [Nocardioides sp.]|nr:DUF6318 family protein [Nocardioides sp.]